MPLSCLYLGPFVSEIALPSLTQAFSAERRLEIQAVGDAGELKHWTLKCNLQYLETSPVGAPFPLMHAVH